jgi:PucR family transcriptional regulator, purine catabolism regulatory protein
MAITVGELILLPHLQMSLVAGGNGLDREITWVHTSDLPEPWAWLGAGELLLTNGTGLAPEAAGQARFVDRLAQAGASGLGIGLGMSGPPLTPELLARAGERGLPVVTVPYSMTFTTVVRAVADANAREESRQLGRVARVYELLRTSVLTGRSGPELFRKLGQELGARLLLVDPATGNSVFGDGERTSFARSLTASYAMHAGAVPGVARLTCDGAAPGEPGAAGEPGPVAVAVAVPGDPPTVLIAEPVSGPLPSLVLLHHIATGAALEIAQLTADQDRQRRLGEQLLSRLLDRRIDPGVAEPQIEEAGLDLPVSVLATARAGPGETGAGLHRALTRSRIPHLVLARDGMIQIVLPESAVVPGLAAGLPAIGASGRIGGAGRLPEAAQEARWALGAAEAEQRALVRFGDETSLLLPRSAAEAQAVVSRILGPLITHDACHATDYLGTLQAVLDHDRSWQLAAQALHIHKQTLGYRIRKIEQLTGRGIARTEHLAEWWFALRAHELLDGGQATNERP